MSAFYKELFRKSIHICSAFVPLLLHFLFWPCIVALAIVGILYFVCELLRINGKPVPLISWITLTASREQDTQKIIAGPIFLVAGIIVSSLILPEKYYTVGIFALAFGDGLASLVGKKFGNKKIPFTKGKSYAGSFACFAAVFISSIFITKSWLLSFFISIFVTFIEALPLGDLDNLFIPITGGAFYLLLDFLI